MKYADTINGAGRVLDADMATGYVKQYFSAWTLNAAGDTVMPGAFAKTIQEQGPTSAQNRMKLLYHHMWPMMLGVAEEVYEDDHGLVMGGRISQTSWGQDVLVLYRDGVITEGSIGYDVVRETWNEGNDGYDIHEIRLYEGSPVAFGMNKDTPPISVNSGAEVIERMMGEMSATERVLRSANWQTDEIPTLLEKQVEIWRGQLSAMHSAQGDGQRTPDLNATPGGDSHLADIAPSDLDRIAVALHEANNAYERV